MYNCVGFSHIRPQFTLEALERDTGVTSDNITTLIFCMPGVAYPTTSTVRSFVRTCDPKTLVINLSEMAGNCKDCWMV